jgi:hypothetical protein
MQMGGLKGDPTNPKFLFDLAQIGMVIARKSVLVCSLSGPPTEFNFEAEYGEIVDYHWYGSSMLLVGFTKGWIVALSMSIVELIQTRVRAPNSRQRVILNP